MADLDLDRIEREARESMHDFAEDLLALAAQVRQLRTELAEYREANTRMQEINLLRAAERDRLIQRLAAADRRIANLLEAVAETQVAASLRARLYDGSGS